LGKNEKTGNSGPYFASAGVISLCEFV